VHLLAYLAREVRRRKLIETVSALAAVVRHDVGFTVTLSRILITCDVATDDAGQIARTRCNVSSRN